jgi:molecular chaperone HtpG
VPVALEKSQLYKWLRSKDESLATRVLHIRAELSKWLPKVDQFFPHYPSHGVDHSDRIVEQLSRMLFAKTHPVVQFSTAEVYCLLCAAYLHDMGMVVSPGDASAILGSDEWKTFVGPKGKGREAFDKYVALRDGPMLGTKEQTAFVADQSLRYLIADFVRRSHHERGKMTLEMHPFLRQLVDDGDSVAFETIADLGIAHGLPNPEVADDMRFPEERDVFDGKVNVRFLARLLRIGDLLDMSTKRADPMTGKAVGPLPTDALPHWQQYAAKKHENVTAKTIEFTFECKDQDAHRVLLDWFSWLEAEVHTAGLEQLHSSRHETWKAPECTVTSQASADTSAAKAKATIIVRPSRGAKYLFHNWRLELDNGSVLRRLIHDVYNDPVVFVRELIQNALDATRCQMYLDFASQHPGDALPERPTQFGADLRERYPIVITFGDEEVRLSPDGPTERRSVFTIDDRGTGMDEEIICRYFLQVGRSYYESSAFRERYKFAPSSRFGIGFLSVFAVSSDIRVETARRDDATGKIIGIRLGLREPTTYLLTEPWTPFEERSTGAKTGTRIRVVLDSWPSSRPLRDHVAHWCVAVEVPVIVREGSEETVIRAHRKSDCVVIAAGRANPEARFIVRTFDIASNNVEGQVALIAYEDSAGEGWCDCWPDDKDLGGRRLDKLPPLSASYTALHGVRMSSLKDEVTHPARAQWYTFCDVRSKLGSVSLARSSTSLHGARRRISRTVDVERLGDLAAEATARRALEKHLAVSRRAEGLQGAYYIGEVISASPTSDEWRNKFPKSVLMWQDARQRTASVEELLAIDEVVVVARNPYRRKEGDTIHAVLAEASRDAPAICWHDTPSFAHRELAEKLRNMNLVNLRAIDSLYLLTFSAGRSNASYLRLEIESVCWVLPRLPSSSLRLRCDFMPYGKRITLLNGSSAFIKWLLKIRRASGRKHPVIQPADVKAILDLVADRPFELDAALNAWDRSPSVPRQLKPPKIKNQSSYFLYGDLVSDRSLHRSP